MPDLLRFEHVMRIFWGDKANQIAASISQPKERKKWLRKTIKKIVKVVGSLDTSENHKRVLLTILEGLDNEIKKATNMPSWRVIDTLFMLSGILLGFSTGSLITTPVYEQDVRQYYSEKLILGLDVFKIKRNDTQDAISIRAKIVTQLRAQGLSMFNIALVLNTTEYRVKHLAKIIVS